MGKKLLCLIVVAIFAFLTFPCSSSAYTDTDHTKYEQAANCLYALGFLDDSPENALRVSEPMTRGDFAVLLAKVENITLLPGVSYFYDVPSTDAICTAVNTVCERGLITVEDRYFRPDDPVDAETLSYALVKLLGYPIGNTSAIFRAAELDLLDNVVLSEKMTRGEVILAIYNTLLTKPALHTAISENGDYTYQIQKGSTLLSENFNIYKASGQFTAVGEIDLVRTINRNEELVRIDDIIYQTGDAVQVDQKQLARNITFYYYDAEDVLYPELLYYELDGKDEVYSVSSENINKKSSQTQLIYDENGRSRTEKISMGAKFIVNGYLIADADKNDALFDINSGSVTLVRPANGLHELVWIDSYQNYIVEAVGLTSFMVNRSGETLEIDLDSEKENIEARVYAPSGKEGTINDILKNTAVALAEVTAADGVTYRTVHVLNSISGKLTELSDHSLTIDDVSYKSSADFDAAGLQAGFQYTFYLGMDGRVCLWSSEIIDNLVLGYLVNAAIKNSGIQHQLVLKILEQNGEKRVYEIPSALYINDIKCTEDRFLEPGSPVNTYLFDGGAVKRQVVAFKLNQDGLLTSLYTAMPEGTEDVPLVLDVPRDKRLCKGGAVFNFGGILTPNARGFVVAAPLDASEADDEDFEIVTAANFTSDTSYEVEGYNVNDLCEADVIVAYMNKPDMAVYNPSNTITCVFDKKTSVLLDSGEITTSITYWQNGTRYTKPVAIRDESKQTYLDTLKEVEKLKRGDCFKIELTADSSMIKNLEIEFTESNRISTSAALNHSRQLLYGQVEAVGPNSLVIRGSDPSSPDYLGETKILFKNAGRVKTYVYTGDKFDIECRGDSLNAVRVGDWVLMHARYEAVRSLVIYRDDTKLPSGEVCR